MCWFKLRWEHNSEKRFKNEKNQQLPGAKGHNPQEKNKNYLFLRGYDKLLAIIKSNSELYSVDNRVRCCFPAEVELHCSRLSSTRKKKQK